MSTTSDTTPAVPMDGGREAIDAILRRHLMATLTKDERDDIAKEIASLTPSSVYAGAGLRTVECRYCSHPDKQCHAIEESEHCREMADQREVDRILGLSDEDIRAEIVAEGRDSEALAEAMRGQMGATFKMVEEIKHWKEEARSWRTVAERLETEKQAAQQDAVAWHVDYKAERRAKNAALSALTPSSADAGAGLREALEDARDTLVGIAKDVSACAWLNDEWPTGIIARLNAALAAIPEGAGSVGGEETFDTIAQWCEETFGPVTPERIARRAAEEMDELLGDPARVEEAADVLICLSRYPGLWAAVQAKMQVNRKRVWRLTGDGCGYHVPADGAALSAPPAQAETAGEERWGVEDTGDAIWVGPMRPDGSKIDRVVYFKDDLGLHRREYVAQVKADACLICDSVNRALAAHRHAAQAGAGDGWQPIETAPTDGTKIQGYGPHKTEEGGYVETIYFWNGHWPIKWMDGFGEPTHWRHLPAAPIGTGNGEASGS